METANSFSFYNVNIYFFIYRLSSKILVKEG